MHSRSHRIRVDSLANADVFARDVDDERIEVMGMGYRDVTSARRTRDGPSEASIGLGIHGFIAKRLEGRSRARRRTETNGDERRRVERKGRRNEKRERKGK